MAPAPAAGPGVAVSLSAPPGPRRCGWPVAIEVRVQNTGTEEIWLVGVLDGSEEGTRFPVYRPRVLRGDVEVAGPPPPEDPLVAPLRPSDFRRLAPGESFDPTRAEEGAAYLPLTTFATFFPREPGTYRYVLTLSTASTQAEQWLGRFGQEPHREQVLALLPRVPRLTVVSNVVEVEVAVAAG